jgi:hypothetical protein
MPAHNSDDGSVRRSRRRVVRRACRRCGMLVWPGVLVAGECPACTGIQPLPIRDDRGRFLSFAPVLPETPAGSTGSTGSATGGGSR